MRRALLIRLANLGMTHYRWIFGGCALVAAAVVALFVLNPPRIQSDILDLLPQKHPVVKDFRMAMQDFKSLDYLFLLLETDNPKAFPIQSYEDFADSMAEGLRKSPNIEGVEYRIQDYEGILKAMLPYTLLYLDPGDLDKVSARFGDSAIREQVQKNREMITNPASLFTKELVELDPFGLLPVFKEHFAGKSRQMKVDLSDGYYVSEDGSCLLLIVRPRRPAQDIPFGKALLKEVRRLEEAVRKEAASAEDEDLKHLKVELAGGYPIAVSDAELIKRDAIINSLTSVILVLFIYMWAFRRKSSLAYGWIPLLFGLLVTFGVVHLLGVTINSGTAGFGALLVGLGIDFSTVLYGRYIEERNRGVSVDQAILSIMGNTGRGVWIGAVTTATTFGAMVFTSFVGMKQVGALTACGIILCVLSVFILLPPMLYYHHIHTTRKGEDVQFHMKVFGVEALGKFAHRHPRATLWTILALTGGFLVAAFGIQLDDNIQNLRSKKNEGILVSERVGKIFGASLSYMMVVVDGSGPKEVVEKSRKVLAAVKPFMDRGEVLFSDALSTYLPPVSGQEAVIRKLESEKDGAFSYDRIRGTFLAACTAQGFDPAYFEPYMGVLSQMVRPTGPLTYEALKSGPISPLLSKYIVQKGPGHFRGVVYLYIPEEYKRFEPDGLVKALQSVVPDAKLVGINRVSRVLRGLVKRDARLAFILGGILVFGIILFDFRSWRSAFLSLMPLTVGLIWMLGTLSLLGEPLNMMNIFVTTMIIGIGSDYGIYFVHRYLEDDGHDMVRVIHETGKPIVIAALTTIAGFGSMVLSSYPGLRSMGYVSLLGTLYCMIHTLTFLVALLTLTEKRAPGEIAE